MDIKPWQIVVLGPIILVISKYIFNFPSSLNEDFDTFFIKAVFTSLFLSGPLYFNRTRRIGILLTILLGICFFVFSSISLNYDFDLTILISFITLGGVFSAKKYGIINLVAIRSYEIALLGIFIQIFIVPLIESIMNNYSSHGSTTLSTILAAASVLFIIPVLLLYFEKTKKLGAVSSIILGSLPLIVILLNFNEYLTQTSDGIKTFYDLFKFNILILIYTISATFVFVAGILYFYRKSKGFVADL